MKFDTETMKMVEAELKRISDKKLDCKELISEMGESGAAAELKALRDQKKLVQEARRRIDDGTFGVCLECGEDISLKRIRAVPEGRYCINCQNSIDRAEKGEVPQHFEAGTSFA